MRVTAINTNQNTTKKQSFGVEVESFKPLTDGFVHFLDVEKATQVAERLYSKRSLRRLEKMRLSTGEDAKIKIDAGDIKGDMWSAEGQWFDLTATPKSSKGCGEYSVFMFDNSPRKVVQRIFWAIKKSLGEIETNVEFKADQAQLARAEFIKKVAVMEENRLFPLKKASEASQ